MIRRLVLFIALFSVGTWNLAAHGEDSNRLPIVDFNPDNGRNDVLTKEAYNWAVPQEIEHLEKTIHGVSLTVRPKVLEKEGQGKITSGWWKAGYDAGATLVSDGISTNSPNVGIEITIRGLTPGAHQLITWHNAWDARPFTSPILVSVYSGDKRASQMSVIPSHREREEDMAVTSFLNFDVTLDEPIVVLIESKDRSTSPVLNGLQFDHQDPYLQVRSSRPRNADEHVVSNPTLSWEAPFGRRPDGTRDGQTPFSYHVYFGEDERSVEHASQQSINYRGRMTSAELRVQADNCLSHYFWRVDSEDQKGNIVPGKVNRFRVRELAFPGAEGYGRYAIGGRGGRVIEVTNLNDAGPGSLREAIDAYGPRTIVFRISGTIVLKSKLIIRNPYVTIAGQTAPGDGICVRGYTFGCFGTHDAILRYLRIRVGDESGETMDGTGFASTDHSIFDHCSISWSIDEAVSSRGAKNITLQRCIVAEALNIALHKKYKPGTGHSFAGSISGDVGSFHHNLVAHCAGRNWSLAGGLDRGGKLAGKLDIRNNVIFNWQHRTNDGGVKALNLVNNLYIPGPSTKVFHLLKPDVGSPQDRQQYFVTGNKMEGVFESNELNWNHVIGVPQDILDQVRLDAPFCESFVTTHSTEELLDNVLADVGVNYSRLDAVDARIIDNVRNRTTTFQGSRGGLAGIIDSQADAGGWPELQKRDPPTDSDHDGISDQWETQKGLNPMVPDQNSILLGDRITALERYLDSLVSSKNKVR